MGVMGGVKACCCCSEVKALSEFYQRKDGNKGHRSECKSCWKIKTDAYTAANKPRLAYLHKMKNIEKKYTITREDYAMRLLTQEHCCAICRSPFEGNTGSRSPSVDHNHTTGLVREIICNGCNAAIGMMDERPTRLRAAAAYLEKHL
jgi:Recombination endonuclease VII